MIVVLVFGRVDEQNRLAVAQVFHQLPQLRVPFLQLLFVPPLKFVPPFRIVVEPLAQLRAGSQFFRPIVEPQQFLLDATRLEPVHKHTIARG